MYSDKSEFLFLPKVLRIFLLLSDLIHRNSRFIVNRCTGMEGVLGESVSYLSEQKYYQCSQCHRSYKYLRNLKYHMSRECGFQPPFKCPYCWYRSTRKSHLKSHVYSKHLSSNKNSIPFYKGNISNNGNKK